MPLAVLLLVSLALLQNADGELAAADDPRAAVFIPDLCAPNEGAPPAQNLGKLILLTDLAPGDPYRAVVDLLAEGKDAAAVLEFPPARPAEARSALLEHLPEFVILVTRPERIDVNIHLELLELAAGLDADPFADFAFGYVTGATADEAMEFARRIVTAERRRLPRTLLRFGPAARSSYGGPAASNVAKGWKETHASHATLDEFRERVKDLGGYGMVRAGGHGMPDGIVDGLKGKDLRALQIDFSPAVYFSGPCYCGVTGPWYELEGGAMRRREIDPPESFGLAAIASGVTALFAGLDPDRGETTSQEMEHLLIHGDALGHAAKETYDGAAVALRRPRLEFYRYEDGKQRPQRNLSVRMIGSGAARALFGDPSFVPWKAAAAPPFPVRLRDRKDALHVSWQAREAPTKYWMSVDVFHGEGGWTHRIQFREEIPLQTAAALRSFAVLRVEAHDGPLEVRFPTAMIERWGGKAYLHVYLVFPPAGEKNAFFVNRDYDASFRFGK